MPKHTHEEVVEDEHERQEEGDTYDEYVLCALISGRKRYTGPWRSLRMSPVSPLLSRSGHRERVHQVDRNWIAYLWVRLLSRTRTPAPVEVCA